MRAARFTALVLVLASCKGDSQSPGMDASDDVDRAAILASIASCTHSVNAEFEVEATALRDATAAHAAAPTADTLAAARTAWLSAIAAWQRAELFQFGPAAVSSEPGGQDLRDQIYSWPLANRCKVEEQVVNQVYADPTAFAATLINGRGLVALEYLLFYEGTDNACGSFSPINANGTWAALEAGELAQRKADYAAAAAADVLTRAATLENEWAPGGAFRGELEGAVGGNDTFAGAQAALNAVSNALFYIDQQTKDAKLALPLGLRDCAMATCPDSVESRYAHISTTHIAQNVVGFERLFEGCPEGAIGFDDWLREAGAGDLADRMHDAIAAAHAAAADVDPALEADIAAHPDKVTALHEAIKGITDLMKSEVVTVLDLELPATVEGDND